mmetsp:Transcript_131337/g.379944  ORF Transcript_131337/g.379944 Transcript_131337/m.379944 type:complete len:184 (-) Transcript_131337:23-574(-)|eukprot:CAMPEP_0176033946 /NCGR_PEP_ID=MMETSP0120_2-20121206/16774_1 /TAXON_ID=160619 /ORGANISM="Kryptoperidinium foliaceum, Strain CCMP 1326" /LENGTH=183 /DNA_ID=CAMNT_0017367281 /DNA_START=92 /DNA_END=643 /DNA_ORIENTATION=-
MAALSLAVVGKNNEPLYLKEFREADLVDDLALFGINGEEEEKSSKETWNGFQCSCRQQFIMHAALERVEQLAGPEGFGWRAPNATGADAMFVGLLAPVEETRVYGYVTTTGIKFILVVEDEAVPDIQKNVDDEIKALMIEIHNLFVADLMNPFKEIGSHIQSKRFVRGVQNCVAAFNQTDGII